MIFETSYFRTRASFSSKNPPKQQQQKAKVSPQSEETLDNWQPSVTLTLCKLGMLSQRCMLMRGRGCRFYELFNFYFSLQWLEKKKRARELSKGGREREREHQALGLIQGIVRQSHSAEASAG